MTTSSTNGPFVATLLPELVPKLRKDLEDQGFVLSKPQYTLFSAKKTGISVTLYSSLKLTVQGKEKAAFIEFYLEPEILKDFSFSHPAALVDQTARIGVDEAGKGDFFGPLCVAGVFATSKQVLQLVEIGVRDSKTMNDSQILRLASEIRKICDHEVVRIPPARYNELYVKFKNLNSFLAWGHATVIEALNIRTKCKTVLIDKFANEFVVQNAVKQKKLQIDLEQKVRAESDVVVAAASILARAAFVEGMKKMSDFYGFEIPKGASKQVIAAGKKLVALHGKEVLSMCAKTHFKTTNEICG